MSNFLSKGTQALATISWIVIEPSTAANNNSPFTPGYRETGQRLFYVSERGRSWLVRDAHGLVQLTPAALPRDCRVADEITSVKRSLVAEAAELLDQHQPAGVYHDAGLFYVLTVVCGETWMLYGTSQTLVRVPTLPPRAILVDIPPREITTAIERIDATA
jgi:hypothetical protein